MSNTGGGGGANYQATQQRRHFAGSDRGGLPPLAANASLTAATGAKGQQMQQPPVATKAPPLEPGQHHSLAMQVQTRQFNNNNAGYNLKQQAGQQQQSRHFYGPPAELMTMHSAMNGMAHQRQDQQTGFTADQPVARQSLAVAPPSQRAEHANWPRDEQDEPGARPARSRLSDQLFQHDDQQSKPPPPPHRHRPGPVAAGQQDQHLQNPHLYNHHYHQHQHAGRQPPAGRQEQRGMTDRGAHERAGQLEEQEHQYANQLRRSQAQQRIGLHSGQPSLHPATYSNSKLAGSSSAPRQMQAAPASHRHAASASGSADGGATSQPSGLRASRDPGPHVNFNRSSQSGALDADEGGESTRKKKYLTAKYGQQQMNLIKKRLKIEMWLHDQLQELAKLSKSADPDEVDEIDIDLDQLLDMDDEATRRHWLRKTLGPLSDLPAESIEEFISDVLEQSKLL